MIQLHKIAFFVMIACLVAANLHARTGVAITWSYKGGYHQETTANVKVSTPSGQNDDVLIPVEDFHYQKDTGQRVVVHLVNAYCVPPFRGLAEGNLLLIFLA